MKRLTRTAKILGATLGLLLILAGITWWKTAPPPPGGRKTAAAAIATTDLVDQTTYVTAQRLAQVAITPEEQTLSQSALRIADHELDLAFTEALRDAEAHPPALNSDAAAIQARIAKSQTLLGADQQQVNQFTAALTQAKPDQKDKIQDQLDLAQSQLELDKDELDEANQNLVEAGGNPRQQIQSMVKEHEAEIKAQSTPTGPKAAADEQRGAVGKFREWWQLRLKEQALEAARNAALIKARALVARHAALASGLDATKGSIPELARHTKAARDAKDAKDGAQTLPQTPQVQHSHEDAATLVERTKAIAADQTILTLVNRRIADQNQLAGVYGQWASVISLQSLRIAHGLLLDALIVIGVLILLLLLDGWLQHLLDRPKLDRRQVETLRSITRMSLRVVAALIVLLVVIGMPSQFATTIGLVGAGLTVALKDFIVAFFGWLVLMGRNGIRLGDWVEINGVSGEVTELGMFHTVLLETGNWSDPGHPTGRRVTFTNSFAIEGHYFNFSTSGQWLWDELQVVVPLGRDPYPIVEAITEQVGQATADSARQAEQEWQRAVPAQRGKSFSGTPGVNLKPVVGGVEISVRYITRANERYLVRAKLYHQAVDLLGAKQA
ncbi:MAG TPA: mechanosensitive ion channel domain-containing protein [Steroidobacteraceae bacterium]|jgi:small-conductance mechanosensitive channel|nr:mechanosensitive ion channel domain-containing protein [Steroidobacteraceae bacterium]